MPGRSTLGDVTMPIAARPRSKPVSSLTVSLTASTAPSAARACGSTALPTSVSRTDRPDRSSKSWPSSRSSLRIWALTPGWLTSSCCAALVKLPESATVTRYSSCRNSIIDDYRTQTDHVLDFCTTAIQARSQPTKRRPQMTMSEGTPSGEIAQAPEDLSRLFVQRANARDADGMAALYAKDAVLAYPAGTTTVGRDAIRAVCAQLLEHVPLPLPVEESLPSLRHGDLALTSTRSADGA